MASLGGTVYYLAERVGKVTTAYRGIRDAWNATKERQDQTEAEARAKGLRSVCNLMLPRFIHLRKKDPLSPSEAFELKALDFHVGHAGKEASEAEDAAAPHKHRKMEVSHCLDLGTMAIIATAAGMPEGDLEDWRNIGGEEDNLRLRTRHENQVLDKAGEDVIRSFFRNPETGVGVLKGESVLRKVRQYDAVLSSELLDPQDHHSAGLEKTLKYTREFVDALSWVTSSFDDTEEASTGYTDATEFLSTMKDAYQKALPRDDAARQDGGGQGFAGHAGWATSEEEQEYLYASKLSEHVWSTLGDDEHRGEGAAAAAGLHQVGGRASGGSVLVSGWTDAMPGSERAN